MKGLIYRGGVGIVVGLYVVLWGYAVAVGIVLALILTIVGLIGGVVFPSLTGQAAIALFVLIVGSSGLVGFYAVLLKWFSLSRCLVLLKGKS